MINEIEQLLNDALDVHSISVANESYKHKGHAGDDGSGQTHFKLSVVSSDFNDLGRVQRQRLVMSVLSGLFSQGLHALSIEALPLEKVS